MSTLTIDGVSLHFERSGVGEDIVLIHGLGANLAFWYPHIVRDLSAEYRVLVYDLCGHGHSETAASGYTSAHMARQLLALMDYCGIRSAHLVGHSFGGAIALHFGLLYPERVKTLTLADAHIHSLQPLPGRCDHNHWQTLYRSLQKFGLDVTPEIPRVAYGFIEEMAAQNAAAEADGIPSDGMLARWEGEPRSVRRWRNLLQNTTALNDFVDVAGLTESEINRIELPVLAIYGQSSRCIPTCDRLAQILKKCTRIILPGVGHFYPVVRPHEFGSYVRSFVKCRNGA